MILDRTEFTLDVMVQMTYKYEEYVADARKRRALTDYFIGAAVNKSVGMKQYSLRIEAQRERLAAGKGWFWPDISLRAGASVGEQFAYDPDDPHTILTVGGLLRWPLQFWGKGKSETRALDYGLESLQYAKDSLRLAAAGGVTARLQDFLAYLDILPDVYDYRRTVKALAEEEYKYYSEGKMTGADMALALDKLTSAEVQAAQSVYDYYRAYSDLLNAAGTGYMIHGSDEETAFYLGLEEYLGLR
jgi:outer membrane protein TolC